MGSVTRVKVFYSNLASFLKEQEGVHPVYGTFLSGTNIYTTELDPEGFIIIGNEAQGISPEIEQFVTRKIFIPSWSSSGTGSEKAESLNASVAAAIVCSEFRRRTHEKK
jgi:TrmH family RNA methyltransferase